MNNQINLDDARFALFGESSLYHLLKGKDPQWIEYAIEAYIREAKGFKPRTSNLYEGLIPKKEIISLADLTAIMKNSEQAQRYYEPLNLTFAKFDIETDNRVNYFLAQATHETAYWSKFEENLNYTTPERIMEVWPTRVTSLELAKSLTKNPEKLGNFIYGGRYKNAPDEGYKFRGRGIFQYTFKHNYLAYKNFSGIDVVSNPDLMLRPDIACDAAGFYWSIRGLNDLADRGDFAAVSEKIQGSLSTLDLRKVALAYVLNRRQ